MNLPLVRGSVSIFKALAQNRREILLTLYLNSNTNLKTPLHFISAHALVESAKSKDLMEIFLNGSLACDSFPLTKYLGFFFANNQQVRGTDFMREFIKNAPRGSRHYFLGGSPETLMGIEIYVKSLEREDLICQYESPPYTSNWRDYSDEWLEKIRNFKAEYVWIGMGSPKQFYISDFIWKNLDIATFSVGAAFDFIGGTKKECPKVVQSIGFEWLFRLLSEPSRLWKRYTVDNLHFILLLINNLIKIKRLVN